MYDLSSEEVRVLGALIEKEHTTPDYYPLTLNSLINACNQKSNREPVVSYGEREVLRAIDGLRDRQFANRVRQVDSRVEKFEQRFGKKQELTLQELAVICVLLLRGAQTMGEIRARCARIYPFENMDEVAVTLETLAEREEGPLVARLPLQPGRKEARFAHLLSGEPELPPEEPPVYAAQPPPAQVDDSRVEALEAEVAALREELAALSEQFQEFKAQFE